MEPAAWDPRVQADELHSWHRHYETSLNVSGGLVALVSALLAFEVLSVNEDTNTFLVLGALNVAIILTWITVARRAAARGDRWAMKARQIEREVLHVPERYSLWNASPEGALPAWIAPGAALIGFLVLWIGLMAYAFWATYLHG